MPSRWMQQMKARERGFRRRLGMLSMTDAERKLYRRKVWIFPNGAIKVESIEKYIARIESAAAEEQVYPKDWWRHLARVLAVISPPFDQIERDIVMKACKEGWRVEKTQNSILRYRRLTGRAGEAYPKAGPV